MITKYSIRQNDTQHTAIWHSLPALLEIRPVWRIDTLTASWDTVNRYLTHVKTGALYVGLVAGGITGTSRGQWFHATCQSVGIQSHENLNESEISWHCVVYGSRNYSSVAFDLNVPLLSNRCHQEAHCPKTNDSFKPLHTSTPTGACRQTKQTYKSGVVFTPSGQA